MKPLPPKVWSAASAAFSPASQALTLAMLQASPAFSPASYAAAPRSIRAQAASRSTSASASGCCTAWCSPIGTPKTTRCRAYSEALARHQRPMPTAWAATISRSGLRPSKSARPPSPGLPISASAGTSTSSKYTVHWFSGTPTITPTCCSWSCSHGSATVKMEKPPLSESRATTSITSESSTAEM